MPRTSLSERLQRVKSPHLVFPESATFQIARCYDVYPLRGYRRQQDAERFGRDYKIDPATPIAMRKETNIHAPLEDVWWRVVDVEGDRHTITFTGQTLVDGTVKTPILLWRESDLAPLARVRAGADSGRVVPALWVPRFAFASDRATAIQDVPAILERHIVFARAEVLPEDALTGSWTEMLRADLVSDEFTFEDGKAVRTDRALQRAQQRLEAVQERVRTVPDDLAVAQREVARLEHLGVGN